MEGFVVVIGVFVLGLAWFLYRLGEYVRKHIRDLWQCIGDLQDKMNEEKEEK